MRQGTCGKRSWVEINLRQLELNCNICKSYLSDNGEIMAVVKADAYGHGDRVVARFLSDRGIRYFAVSNIDEAIHIRESGTKGEILILCYTPVERSNELVEYDLTQTLISEEYAEKISKNNIPIKCQFAIDSGMRRIGLNADEPAKAERIIRKFSKKLILNGLFTHLCAAESPSQDKFTERQIQLFENIVSRVADLNLPFCHCMNSAGGIRHKSTNSCYTRLGIILYGLKPDITFTLPNGIKPVLSWKSVVSLVKNIRAGDAIGYGSSFTATRPMTIATIPTGYADGYPRLLSNKGWVLVNGRRAPIVGRICMDQMMLDVSFIPHVHMETEVTLIGNNGYQFITADDIANLCGTIGYEIVCGINKRVDRVYID